MLMRTPGKWDPPPRKPVRRIIRLNSAMLGIGISILLLYAFGTIALIAFYLHPLLYE